MVLRDGFGRNEGKGTHLLQYGKRTLAGRVLGVGEHDLVFRRGLQRQAERVVSGIITVVGRPAQVWLVEQRALSLVVVIAHLIQRSVLPPAGAEEPQLVPLDRAAQPAPDVVVPSD